MKVMEKKMEIMKEEYQNIPIPDELDFIVQKALKQKKKKPKATPWFVGLAAASILFIGSINVSPAFAKTFEDVPILDHVVRVLTFVHYKVDEGNYQANIEVPKIENMENESLESTLNEKYLVESKELFEEFQMEMEEMKQSGDGHLGIESGYEVKTDTKQILSIGRYVVNTVGSSSTTFKFDTIDKEKELLITLPSLFKSDHYIEIISEEINKQMIAQMKQDPNKIYWIENPIQKTDILVEVSQIIRSEQNFYITEDHKLAIAFDKYEVAPGYMGIVEFIIPTEILYDELVSPEYIK